MRMAFTMPNGQSIACPIDLQRNPPIKDCPNNNKIAEMSIKGSTLLALSNADSKSTPLSASQIRTPEIINFKHVKI